MKLRELLKMSVLTISRSSVAVVGCVIASVDTPSLEDSLKQNDDHNITRQDRIKMINDYHDSVAKAARKKAIKVKIVN